MIALCAPDAKSADQIRRHTLCLAGCSEAPNPAIRSPCSRAQASVSGKATNPASAKPCNRAQVSISGQALVFVVRDQRWSLMARAGAWTYGAFFAAQARSQLPSQGLVAMSARAAFINDSGGRRPHMQRLPCLQAQPRASAQCSWLGVRRAA